MPTDNNQIITSTSQLGSPSHLFDVTTFVSIACQLVALLDEDHLSSLLPSMLCGL